jgi:hypothetical protein
MVKLVGWIKMATGEGTPLEGKYDVLKTFIEQQESINDNLVYEGKRVLLRANTDWFKTMFEAHLKTFDEMRTPFDNARKKRERKREKN